MRAPNPRTTHSKPRRVARDELRVVVVRDQNGDVRAPALRSFMRLMREARTDLTKALWKRDIARCRPSGSLLGSTSLRMRSRVLDHDQRIVETKAPWQHDALGSFATDHARMVLARRVRLGAGDTHGAVRSKASARGGAVAVRDEATAGLDRVLFRPFSRIAGTSTEGALR